MNLGIREELSVVLYGRVCRMDSGGRTLDFLLSRSTESFLMRVRVSHLAEPSQEVSVCSKHSDVETKNSRARPSTP